MITTTGLLVEQTKPVVGLSAITPSSSTPDYVSFKAYSKCTILIQCNNATTVTGSAIALKQATDVSATGEKALAFTTMYANTDTGASDTLVETAVTSNTFTTDDTNDKDLLYVIEVDETDLDLANSFDCIRLDTGDAANTVVSVVYIMWPAEYAKSTPPSAITD